MEGGKEQVGGETFLFRRKFNMSDMTAGGRYVGEREERAIVRGRLRQTPTRLLLLGLAQYIFMKGVGGGLTEG